MRIIFIITCMLFLLSCNKPGKNQNKVSEKISIENKDSLIFNSFIEYSRVFPLNKISSNATFFLNTPYKGGTLDINTKEQLVINLRELDCLTFVENVLALYKCREEKNLSLDNFKSNIKKIRYREGSIKGYISRLHYSTDWLYNNSGNGLIKDITKELGGIAFTTDIDFMSKHSGRYIALKTKKDIKLIKEIEKDINKRKYYFIPKNQVADIENKIQNGDIIFITTNIKGLDIAHLGYAINVNNRIHLIHASSQLNKVIISKNPLHKYLSNINHFTGIMVARIN